MTMIKYNGDKQKAMEELDMSRTVFYDKLKKYNIQILIRRRKQDENFYISGFRRH